MNDWLITYLDPNDGLKFKQEMEYNVSFQDLMFRLQGKFYFLNIVKVEIKPMEMNF